MTTRDEIAARQQAQREQSADRVNPADDQGNRAPDPRVEPTLEDTGAGDDQIQAGADERDAPQPGERTKPIYMSPSDQARAAIAKRFKRDEEGEVPYNGNPNDPEMMYGKAGRAPEQQADPVEPEPEPAPQPEPEKKFTIKVRGKDVVLTEAELLERASKVEAADTYLAESRDLLDQARQIKRERDPADPHRLEARANTQDDRTDPSLSADPQHPEDELEGAIEEVRYGTDSKEAAQKLRNVILKEADKAADTRQLNRLIGNDVQKSSVAMKTFIEANPDLASDEIASQVIEQTLYAIQREELLAMGVEEAKLPKDNAQLANWHRFQRVHGHAVSSPEQMLEKAKARLVQWKGGAKQPQQQAQTRKESPRVEVNVNRDARRAQLPNQPTRSSTPPPPAQRQNNGAPQATSRSDVIMRMRAQRGQHVS